MDGQVSATRNGRCVRILLERPARKNALTEAMLGQFTDVVGELATDVTTDVVVFSGAGTDFCTGSDVGDIAALLALDAVGRRDAFENGLTTRIHPLMRSVLDLPQIVVASARGHAVGLGAALILAADINILSETARLSLPQVALGHTVDHGESYLLPRKIGPSRAMQLILLGERLTPDDAARLGLANFVVADEALDDSTNDVVRRLLSGSSTSLRGTKQVLAGSLDRDREAQLAAEVAAVSACAFSDDFVTAIERAIGGRR